MKAITPLLKVKPSEVLINFMTKDIIRFIDDEASTALSSFWNPVRGCKKGSAGPSYCPCYTVTQ